MDKYQKAVHSAAWLAAYNDEYGVDAVRKYGGNKITADYTEAYISDLLFLWGLSWDRSQRKRGQV